MSRSNPTDNVPNPCTRWHEWDGATGEIRYWNKELPNPEKPDKKGRYVVVKQPFTFILLDELATIKGWHKTLDSAIFSNEVKDIKAERLVVKTFDGGIFAEGFYGSIRDRITAVDGHYSASLYLGYKSDSGALVLGNLSIKGASLNAWVDFCKANRCDLYTKAIKINGKTYGKKGKIEYYTPKFFIEPLSEQTNAAAMALDKSLQDYLAKYFKRTRQQQTANPPPDVHEPAGGEIPDDLTEGLRQMDDPSGKSQPAGDGKCSQCNMPIPPDCDGKCPNCTNEDSVPF